MLVKGIIKTIEYNGNTCTVRIPTFESHRTDEYIVSAAISNQPGCYNGYKEEDVVWIGFDTDQYNQPVVLGKLYLGAAKEKEDPRGTINAENTSASTTATIPFDTRLSNTVDPNIPNTQATYTSLQKLSNQVNETATALDKTTTDFGNRITQLITDTDNTGAQYKSLIQQTAREITAKVEKETTERIAGEEEIKQTTSAELKETASKIQATVENKVDTTSGTVSKGFGWSLSAEDWKVFATANVAKMTDEERQELIDNSEVLVQSNTVYEIRRDADGNPVKDEEGSIIIDEVTNEYFYVNGVRTNIKTNDPHLLASEQTKLTAADVHLTLTLVNDEYYWQLVNNKDTTKQLTITNADGETYKANTKPVLVVTEDGLYVNGNGTFSGTVTAQDGHIGKFVIGKETGEKTDYTLLADVTEEEFNQNPGKYYTNAIHVDEDFIVQVTLSWYNDVVVEGDSTKTIQGNWKYTINVDILDQNGKQKAPKVRDIMTRVWVSGWDGAGSTRVDEAKYELITLRDSITASTQEVVMPTASLTKNPTIHYIKIFTRINTDRTISDVPEWLPLDRLHPVEPDYEEVAYENYGNSPHSIDTKPFQIWGIRELNSYEQCATYDSLLAAAYYFIKSAPSAIYSDGYVDKNRNQITSFGQVPAANAHGVYLGVDGIRLGPNFSVSADGIVTAPTFSVTLTDTQAASLANSMKQYSRTVIKYAIGTTTQKPDADSEAWVYDMDALAIKEGDCVWTMTEFYYLQNGTEITPPTREYTVSRVGKDGTDGRAGKSAFELYKETHPDYTGKEEDWLASLQGTSGNSITSETVYLYQGTTAKEAPKDIEISKDGSTITVGDWQANVLEPTVASPYVWTTNYIKITETSAEGLGIITYVAGGTVSLHATLAGYVDILSANGIGIISTSLNPKYDADSMPDYKQYLYNIKADTITGAIGNQVNIGGQATMNKVEPGTAFDSTQTYYYKADDGVYLIYTDMTADNFEARIASTEGVYVEGFLNGWAIKSATSTTEAAAIYSGDVTEFKDAAELDGKPDATGIYVGTDGIRLGNKFSVDANGNVSASSLKFTASQKADLAKSIKHIDHINTWYGKGTATDKPANWSQTIADLNAKPGDYVWTWTETIYVEGDHETKDDSYSLEYLAENGDTITTDTIYKLGDTTPVKPEDSITTTAPSLPEGWSATPIQATKKVGEHYCYACDVTTTFTKNSSNYSTVYSMVQQFSYYSGIVSTITKYLQTDQNYSGTTITTITEGWLDTRPENKAGYYIWTWIQTTYVDDSLNTNEYYCDYTASNGVSKNVDLTTSAYVVKKVVAEDDTISYDPTEITLTCSLSQDATADRYNLTFVVPNYADDVRTDQTQASQTKTVDSAQLFRSGNTAEIKVKYNQADGSNLIDSVNVALLTDGTNGKQGETGATGRGITGVSYYYATTTEQIQPSPEDIFSPTTLPISNINKYLWQKEVISYTDTTTTTSVTLTAVYGDQGIQGVTGPKGEDGKEYYTWLKYADSPTSGMSDDPTGKTYIGFAYNKDTATESTEYSDYDWSLIKGDSGEPGNGIKEIKYYYGVTKTLATPRAEDIATETMPTIDPVNKYLWQKEVISFTREGVADQITIKLAAVYGDTGKAGANGVSRNIDLISDTYVVKKTITDNGIVYTPSTLNLTCQVSEDACAEAYSLTFKIDNYADESKTYDKGTTSVPKQVDVATLFSTDASSASIAVTYAQDTITIADSLNVMIVSDGQQGQQGENGVSALSMILTNPTMTLRGNTQGVIAGEQESTYVLVYSGTEQLTADPTKDLYYELGTVDYTVHSMKQELEGDQVKITLTTKVSNKASDSIIIPLYIKNKAGDIVSSSNLLLNWVMARDGKDGVSGVSRNIDLISDAYVVKKSIVSNQTVYEPSQINLTCQVSPDACAEKYDITFKAQNCKDYTETELTTETVSKTYNVSDLFAKGETSASVSVVYKQGTSTLHDSLNIIIVSDGTDGEQGTAGEAALAMTLTNPTMTFRGTTDTIIADQNEETYVLVYSGSTRLTTNKAQDLYYELGVISDSTHTITTETDNDQAKITLTTKESKTFDGTITVPVLIKDESGITVASTDLYLTWTTAKAGDKGENGKTTYTWVKYAKDDQGTGISDDSTDMSYIGFAYNKETTDESINPKDYTWSLIKGEDGTGIDQIEYKYLATSTYTEPDPALVNLDTITATTFSATDKYLWQKEIIKYTDTSKSDKKTVALIAVYGDKGENGKAGESGLSMLLTNPTMTFSGDANGVIVGQTETTECMIYSGFDRLTSLATKDQPLSYEINSSVKTYSPHIVELSMQDDQYIISVTTQQTTDTSGKIAIPVEVYSTDTTNIKTKLAESTIYLNWVVAKQGADGEPGATGPTGDSVSVTSVYFYYANTSSTWDSSATKLCPALSNAGSDKPYEDASGNWTINEISPTAAKPYVWQWLRTIKVATHESKTTTTFENATAPTMYNSLDGLVSLISIDGIDIVSKNEKTNEYMLKADKIFGAVGNTVTIGGTGADYMKLTSAATYDSGTTYYKKVTKDAYEAYTDITADNFAEKIGSEQGVYIKFADGWKIKGANADTKKGAAIYSGSISEFSEATSVDNEVVGVYIGTDGIKLGNGFSVDATGHVTGASFKTITSTTTYYQASNDNVNPPAAPKSATDLNGWTTTIAQATTSDDKPYRWSCIITTYSTGPDFEHPAYSVVQDGTTGASGCKFTYDASAQTLTITYFN